MRLFLALALPEAVGSALASLKGPQVGWRWIPRENLHVTLVFLGDVGREAAEDLDEALLEMSFDLPEIRISSIGHFGHAAPRAIWAGVSPRDALESLSGRLASRARKCGMAVERRKFVPHVTLARLPTGTTSQSVAEFAAAHGHLRLPPFRPRGVTLYRSHLRPEGPIYEALATYPEIG